MFDTVLNTPLHWIYLSQSQANDEETNKIVEINESERFSEPSRDTALAAESKKITKRKISKEHFVTSNKDKVCTFILILKHEVHFFFKLPRDLSPFQIPDLPNPSKQFRISSVGRHGIWHACVIWSTA